jgi:RNA polymerase sigma-70 factor (ECF subfamily)
MSFDVGECFERHSGVVYRRCLHVLGNEADAAEAVQEVFVAALSGLGRFRLQAAPLTWLYAIATRHCLQRLRNDSARSLKHALFHDATSVEQDLASRADLDLALGRLSLEELELVVHAFRDGLTQEEIAEVTRQSRKTVGRKVRALAQKLRVELGTPELEPLAAAGE